MMSNRKNRPRLDRRTLFTRLVFLIIAALLWLLIQFSNTQYTTSITVPLDLTDYPTDVLLGDVPASVDFIIRSEGLYMLQNRWKDQDPVQLSLQQLKQADEHRYYLTGISLRESFGDWKGPNVEWIDIRPDTLWFNTREVGRKIVPCLPDMNLEYLIPYGPYGSLEISPDSIWLFGAKEVIDTIRFWQLPRIEAKDIHEDVVRTLELSIPDEDIRLGESTITVRQPVRMFTEKWVSVTLQSDENSRNWIADPKQIDVRCRVAVEDYDRIHGALFDARYQYNPESDGESHVIWEFVPHRVEVLDWRPHYVEIIKSE